MSRAWRFGEYEFRCDTGELRFAGHPAVLQPQPARVLALLLDRAGELVTREEIRRRLWGDSLHVEFDQGINFSIRQLRRALADDAGQPRWIETLPRLGYRFVGAVTPAMPAMPATPATTPAFPVAAPNPPPAISPWPAMLFLALLSWVGGAPTAAPDKVARPAPGTPSALRPPLAPPALAAYGRGLYLSRREGVENVERGIVELRRAAALAPMAAEPRLELAEALLTRHRQGPSMAALREAEVVARQAVDLGPDLARARLARADVALASHYDWESAEADYRAALRLDPGLAPAYSRYAGLLAARGRFDEAIDAARRAQELDPVCLAANADLGRYLYLARRYEEAIAASRAALTLDPRHTLAHLTIIYSELELGHEQAALAQANEHLAALFGDGDRPAPRATSLAGYWRGSVAYLDSEARRVYLPPSDLALLHLQLGEDAAGLRLLQQSCEQHAGRDLFFAAVDPRLDAWRADPRLQRVLTCAGLEDVRTL